MFKSLKIWMVCLTGLFFNEIIIAQTDTLFWFAAPECSVNSQQTDRPILLRFFSYNKVADIKITQPANGSFTTRTLTLQPYSSATIDLTSDIDIIECNPSGQILDFGLRIWSSSPISSYYEVLSEPCKCNPEIFALKGNNALGLEFYVPGQNIFDNVGFYSPPPKNHFIVVATQDNTAVYITPSCALTNYGKGQTFSFNLNKGQTYSCEALSQSAALHCEGSLITSDKPIALTFNDDLLINNFCFDQIGDQAVPNNLLGKEYIVRRGNLTNNDYIRIIPVQNGTLTIDNSSNIAMTKGVPIGLSLTANSTYLKSDQPIQVHHITGTSCEMGSAILPKLECAGSKNITIVRSSSQPLYIAIVVVNGFQNDFLLNGSSTFIKGTDFTIVPGTNSKYVSALIDLTNNTSVDEVLSITNSKNVNFQLGILNGGSTGSRYGYFSNFSSGNFTLLKDKTFLCDGDSVKITIIGADSVKWLPPSLFTGDSLTFRYVKNLNNIKPLIVAKSNAGCSDTLTFSLQSAKKDTISLNLKNCDSSKLTFLGKSFFKSGKSDIIKSGPWGCDTMYSVNVAMNGVKIKIDTFMCKGDSLLFRKMKYGPPQKATLIFKRADGCDTSVDININSAEMKNQFNSNIVCLGSENSISSSIKKDATYAWNTGETSREIKINQIGQYFVTSTTSKCTFVIDTFNIITGDNVLFFPNTFTPNDDDMNEVFPFVNNNLLKIEIYNRWGELIYMDDTSPANWDGKYKNTIVESGLYLAIITYKNCNVKYKQIKQIMFHLLY